MPLLVSAALIAILPGCMAGTDRPNASAASAQQSTKTMNAAQARIADQMRRVADWQLAHMVEEGNPIRRPSPQTYKPRGWVMATFYVGLADAADALNDSAYDRALRDIAVANEWRLGERLTHADDHLVGLLYTRFAERDANMALLAPTRESFDRILADPPKVNLIHSDPSGDNQCSKRWCWADALFMAPATWMALSEVTGDPRYAAYAHSEFWASTDFLYDKDARFFFRDSRFFDERGPDGEKIFWARGNGWVYAGLVTILRTLGKDDPQRARYERLFIDMSEALVAAQQDNGYWHTSLASRRPEPPETSGTGFFVYGLAWGLNTGLLSGGQYEQAVDKGWAALERALSPNGRLGYVQQVGDRPRDVLPDDTQFYGSGAFLLAGRQMIERLD